MAIFCDKSHKLVVFMHLLDYNPHQGDSWATMKRDQVRIRTFLQGFTLVEVSIVMVILAILLVITISTGAEYAVSSRDAERMADIRIITDGLERYYRTQPSSAGVTYPSTTLGATAIAQFIGEADAMSAPGAVGLSFIIAASSSDQTPTAQQYIYQPLHIDGTLCTTVPCPRYKLYFRSESPNEITMLNSMRQQ